MKHYLIIALLITIAFTSCRKESTKANERISGDINVLPIQRQSGIDSGKYFLSCRTEKRYNCSNYAILYGINKNTNSIDVSFTEIHKPEICSTAFGPATCAIPLSGIPSGTYELTFRLRGRKNVYSLIITDNSCNLIEKDKPVNVKLSPSGI